MELEWPGSLALLVVAGALLFVYIFQQRRRQRYALRYASLSLVREAIGRGPGIRRHIPAVLFLLGFVALILALARPAAKVQVPALEGTIVLAIDASGSTPIRTTRRTSRSRSRSPRLRPPANSRRLRSSSSPTARTTRIRRR